MQDVGVQLEGSAAAPSAQVDSQLDDSEPTAEGGVFPRTPMASPPAFAGLVDFAVAGTEASGEFRCSDCGYGAVVHRALPPCPMCGGAVWETRPSRLPD